MKKILVLALAIVMALSVVALVACAKEETYEGEYKYANTYNDSGDNAVLDDYYGCKVTVSVKKGVITKVVVAEDTAKLFNLSSGWGDKAKWTAGAKDMIDSFVGLKVEDVKKIEVAKTTSGAPDTSVETIKNAPDSLKVVATADHTGATQSSGRLILAVQDALKDVK